MKNNWKQYGKIIAAAGLLIAAGICYGIAGRADGMIRLGEEGRAVVMETMEQSADDEMQVTGQTEQIQAVLRSESAGQTQAGSESGQEEIPVDVCYVHVCGEVKNPGVYALPDGSRIFEAVEAAGGLTDEASEAGMNQAQRIADGMQIVIPNREEAAVQEKSREELALGLVNLNTAAKEQLMALPGIGEARAESIIRYREESGGFQSKEEIMQVSGIKEAAYQKIKDRITV